MKPMIKRTILGLAAIVGVLVLTLVGIMVSAFAGRSEIQPTVLEGFSHIVKDGFVSAGVLDMGMGQLALIDAGNDHEGKALKAEVSKMGRGLDAVSAIFLTHGHSDHTAAAMLFPNAKIYAGEGDVGLAEGREGSHGTLTHLMPVKPSGLKITRGLKDGETVQVGTRTVHVFAVPGHTAGSVAYWVDGVLFLGDSAGSSSSGEILPAPAAFSDNPAQNRQSLKELDQRLHAQNLEIKDIVPAHSGFLLGAGPLDPFAATH